MSKMKKYDANNINLLRNLQVHIMLQYLILDEQGDFVVDDKLIEICKTK